MPLNLQAEAAYSVHFSTNIRLAVFLSIEIRQSLYAAFKALNQPAVFRLAPRAAVKVASIYDTKFHLIIDDFEVMSETRIPHSRWQPWWRYLNKAHCLLHKHHHCYYTASSEVLANAVWRKYSIVCCPPVVLVDAPHFDYLNILVASLYTSRSYFTDTTCACENHSSTMIFLS